MATSETAAPAPAVAESTSPFPPFPAREFAIPTVILVALAGAEVLTAALDARIGVAAHAVLLMILVAMGARTADSSKRELYWSLVLAPIIRIGSLSLPLGQLPLLAWYPLIGVPIFTAAIVTARYLGYDRARLGLRVDAADIPRQLMLVPLGVLLGVGEYLIFRPLPLAERFTLSDLWLPALILLIFTGLEEELVFRGIMQRAALRSLGRWGLVYVSGVFAVLHIGYLSVLDVAFVFIVGLMFSLFVLQTKSLFGVTIAHGAINITLFLVLPFLAPVYLGSGYGDFLPLPVPDTTPGSPP